MLSKRVVNILLVLSVSFVCIFAEESFYKFRINKSFVEEVFEKNLKMLFQKTERLQMKDTYLEDLDTKLTNINMGIQPRVKKWEDLKLEVFLDENMVIMELHDLEFSGKGDV